MIRGLFLNGERQQGTNSESQCNIQNSYSVEDFKKVELWNVPCSQKFSLKFLGDDKSGICSSLEFATLEVSGSECTYLSNSIHSIKTSNIQFSFTWSNPSSVFLSVPNDYEVELVIHAVNLTPGDLNCGEWVSENNPIHRKFNSRIHESEVDRNSNSDGPGEGAESDDRASVEELLECEKQEKCECNVGVEGVYCGSIDLIPHNSSFSPNQFNQKWKIAS